MLRKRKICILVLCLVLGVFSSAAYGTIEPNKNIELMAEYYQSAKATLSISDSGVAKAGGSIKGIIGTTTKTSIHLYIQKYKSGQWVNVYDFTSTGDTVTRTLVKEKNVSKGYKYRAKAVCKAYSNSKCETVTRCSSVVSYK